MKKGILGGIDIGSSKIKILVVQREKTGFKLISKIEKDSEGVKKGTISQAERVADLLNEAGKEIGKSVPFFVGVGGPSVSSFDSRGLISVSRADHTISQEDMERAIKASQLINVGKNLEIFYTIPQRFILDGELAVENPVELKALRVEVETLLLCALSNYLESLRKTLLLSGIEVLDFIPSPIALAQSVLKEKEKEMGVCLVNLGAQTTEISLFKDGKLKHFSSIASGMVSLTKKLAVSLKIDFEIAERIKTEYGTCFVKGKGERVELDEETVFTSKFIAREVREGLFRIFEEIKRELKNFARDKDFPCGIVLSGGGAKIRGIQELAKKKFKVYSRIGKPKTIIGLDEDPSFAVVEGLILVGSQEEIQKRGFFSKLIGVFKNFLP